MVTRLRAIWEKYSVLHPFLVWVLHPFLVWVVRLLIALLILQALMPVMPRAYPKAVRSPQSVHEHICVHTRLVDEVFEWKIQQSLEIVREMGASTIVEFFPWAYYEGRGKGQFNWERPDMIMRHAAENDLQVIARLGFVPQWAQADVTDESMTLNTLPEASFGHFADFAAAFAARYAEQVSAIIIWNEANLSFEWGFRPVDPIAYTDLLRESYQRIKMRVPTMTVLGGALAPTLEPVGSPNGMNDLYFLEAMYAAGAGDYMDGLAVHTYGLSHPPEAEPDADELNFRRVELLKAMGDRFGYDLPITITESGWNDHPRWVHAVTPGERAQYTVRALQMAADWEWLDAMCLWVLRYPVDTLTYPDYFTLITHDFQRKPIYDAIWAYAHDKGGQTPLWLPPPTP